MKYILEDYSMIILELIILGILDIAYLYHIFMY